MQCTNMKFTSLAYNTCEMVKNRKVVSIKVTSVYVMSFFSLQQNINSVGIFNRNSIEIGVCVQSFVKLLLNTAIFN